ncbi:hypothetical protein EFK13_03250 [Bacillus cabrialesii]|nr:hypothetical protein [Bacillus cabrialesii]UQE79663.1 hypothetical protein EFK13_03250 [Bacillus cabrialesii]
MTSTQTVVMISIGTIIVQPIIENRSGDFSMTLILMEWLQIRFNFIEKMLTGK